MEVGSSSSAGILLDACNWLCSCTLLMKPCTSRREREFSERFWLRRRGERRVLDLDIESINFKELFWLMFSFALSAVYYIKFKCSTLPTAKPPFLESLSALVIAGPLALGPLGDFDSAIVGSVDTMWICGLLPVLGRPAAGFTIWGT